MWSAKAEAGAASLRQWCALPSEFRSVVKLPDWLVMNSRSRNSVKRHLASNVDAGDAAALHEYAERVKRSRVQAARTGGASSSAAACSAGDSLPMTLRSGLSAAPTKATAEELLQFKRAAHADELCKLQGLLPAGAVWRGMPKTWRRRVRTALLFGRIDSVVKLVRDALEVLDRGVEAAGTHACITRVAEAGVAAVGALAFADAAADGLAGDDADDEGGGDGACVAG